MVRYRTVRTLINLFIYFLKKLFTLSFERYCTYDTVVKNNNEDYKSVLQWRLQHRIVFGAFCHTYRYVLPVVLEYFNSISFRHIFF